MQTGFSIYVILSFPVWHLDVSHQERNRGQKQKMAHAGFLLWLAEILNQEVIFVISNISTFPTVRYLEYFN